MRVLVAAHDLHPDPESGGTGRYVRETASRLTDRGHDVTVVTRRRGDVALAERRDGVRVRRYDLSIAGESTPGIARQLPGAASQVASAVADAGGDALDAVSFQGPVTAVLADRAAPDDVLRSCTFHSPWPEEYLLRTRADGASGVRRRLNAGLRRRLEARVLARADHVTTLSEFVRDRLRRRYDPDAPVSVVPGGVDLDRFHPDAGSHPAVAADGTAFLTVRRLTPRMGHAMLLRAFAAATDDAHLYVAGDGRLRAALEARARSLGVANRVTFLGYVPDDDLPALYAAADVFALPTRALEGFGLATLEALASGTPVVATPVGGSVELLGPLDDALPAPALVESAITSALADGLAAWTALDSDALAAAGDASRRHAESYAWSETVDALEAKYAALGGRRRDPAGVAEPNRPTPT
jgi:glycosyltransferase involved in cell wall biosynthesis